MTRCRDDRDATSGLRSLLARVEGEGALCVTLTDGEVERRPSCEIYEPPRFFEALLRGRALTELPDITARICGICPVAYQTSACNAMEARWRRRRRTDRATSRQAPYCGEWIESHALHIYLLHAPDFLGYPERHRDGHAPGDIEQRALRLKKAGNAHRRR